MPRQNKFSDPKDREIYDAHRRYLKVMEEQRLITLSEDTKLRYLNMITSLTDKLEVPGKPLSEVVREIMAEAATLIFQAMQG